MAQEPEGLRWIQEVCEHQVPERGHVYERERVALARCIDLAFAEVAPAARETAAPQPPDLDQGGPELGQHTMDGGIPARHEKLGDAVQADVGTVNVEDPRPCLPQD
jgi:hypothetical protein